MSAPLVRRIYRRAYWFPRDLVALTRAHWPQHIIYFGGKGFGDDLLLGAVAMELHRRGLKRVAVITRLGEIFENFPSPLTILDERNWGTLEAQLRFGRRAAKAEYYRGFKEPDQDIWGPYHLIGEMCYRVGIRGSVELRPYFFLSPEERKAGRLVDNQAVIQCTDETSRSPNHLKFWIRERHQDVVDQNRHRLNFVQLGGAGDPPLRGVLDLRGRTSIRQTAAVLAESRLMIGYVGFQMHLARAVECPGVIIYGGREHPAQTGYCCNENLYTALPCAPCWHRNNCDLGHECMQRITAADVTESVSRILSRPRSPLATESQEV